MYYRSNRKRVTIFVSGDHHNILKLSEKVFRDGDGLQSPLNVVHDTRRMLFVSRQYKVPGS